MTARQLRRQLMMIYRSYATDAWVAAGHYDSIDTNCLAYLTPEGQRWRSVRPTLVSFDDRQWTEDVLRLLSDQGLKPASFPQLLAFGTQFPNEQLAEGSIVALAESWTTPDSLVEQVPMLTRSKADAVHGYGYTRVKIPSSEFTKRGLFRHAVHTCWYPGTRFLAVPK